MTLKELVHGCKPIEIIGNTDIVVTGIEIDSRKCKVGCIFVAVKGTQTDGHAFIDKAIELGAKVIVCESKPEVLNQEITYVVYQDTSDVVGPLATVFYGNPTTRMKLVGITGTNGKTTIATTLYNIVRRMGLKAGLCSTVCNYVDGEPFPTECTTPDPITLNRLLGEMANRGCEYAFMEVSSHAVDQKRIAGLNFAGGVFTNLTRDHLDYHKTFENYRDAKKGFFDMLNNKAFAVTNKDDKNGLIMTQNTKAEVKTYSIGRSADFNAKILEESFEGMNLEINGMEVFVQFVGKFNVQNILAIYGTLRMMGVETQEALIQLSAMKPVNGRFETFCSAEGVTAVIDYAHTPDALNNVLTTINEVLNGKGKCWTVCGAGGNRDKGKRPLMAQEAARQSDKIIITSDNPRDEEPQDIINDMLAGLNKEQLKKTISIVDRREAIRTACMMAQRGDVILVAGKGHEDYQIIKGVKYHFDDHEVVREAFGLIANEKSN